MGKSRGVDSLSIRKVTASGSQRCFRDFRSKITIIMLQKIGMFTVLLGCTWGHTGKVFSPESGSVPYPVQDEHFFCSATFQLT